MFEQDSTNIMLPLGTMYHINTGSSSLDWWWWRWCLPLFSLFGPRTLLSSGRIYFQLNAGSKMCNDQFWACPSTRNRRRREVKWKYPLLIRKAPWRIKFGLFLHSRSCKTCTFLFDSLVVHWHEILVLPLLRNTWSFHSQLARLENLVPCCDYLHLAIWLELISVHDEVPSSRVVNKPADLSQYL